MVMTEEDKDFLFTKERLVANWFAIAICCENDMGDINVIYFENVELLLNRTLKMFEDTLKMFEKE